MFDHLRLTIPLLLVIGLSGCKVEQVSTDAVHSRIPTSFTLAIDSASLQLPEWRKVLFDSTLIRLTEEALLSGFEIREAIIAVSTSQAGLVNVRGIRLPDLNAVANAGAVRFGDYTMDGVGNYDTRFSPNAQGDRFIPDPMPIYSLGIHTNWELDLWGKLKNRKRAAVERFAASNEAVLLMQTQVISQVAETYYHLVAAERQLTVIREFMELQRDQSEAVQLLKEAGRSNQLAVETMKARLLSSQVLEVEAIKNLRTFEAELSLQLGRMPGRVDRDTNALSIPESGLPNTGVPSQLLTNRPDIRAAERELKAARADLHAARAALYPTLTISAGIGYNAFNAALLFSTPASLAWSVLGGITAPLLNRRVLMAEMMASTAAQRAALLSYERTVTRAVSEVYVTLAMLRAAEDVRALKLQETERFSEAVRISMELFATGRASYLDVVTAQESLLNARLSLIEAEQKRAVLRTVLYRTLGGGAGA